MPLFNVGFPSVYTSGVLLKPNQQNIDKNEKVEVEET